MSINLTLLFNRLRVIDRAFLSHSRYFSEYASAAGDAIRSIDYEADTIFGQYQNSEQDLVSGADGLYAKVQQLISSVNSDYFDYLAGLAQRTLIRMAGDAYRIQDNDIEKSLRALISQMKSQSQTITRATVNVSVSLPSTNFGNGAVVVSKASLHNPGQDIENAYDETFDIRVESPGTFDTPASLSIVGDTSIQKFMFRWPMGSGVRIDYDAILPQSASNRVSNASFDSWSSNAPNNWIIIQGVSPTDFNIESAVENVFYKNGSAIRFVSPSTNVILRQDITNGYEYSSAFFLGMWLRRVGTPTATKKITLSLIDDVGTITDINGSNITVEALYDTNMPTNTYRLYGNIFFTSNRTRPVVFLNMVAENPGSTGSVLCDGVFFVPATELYPGGPHVVVVQGGNPFVRNDTGVITVSVTRSKWQTVFERFFNMTSDYRLLLPSAATGSIPD